LTVVKEGSFIKINYTSITLEDGKAFDTSVADVAKDNQIFTEEKVYEPMLLVLGSNWFPPMVEKSLIGRELGETVDIIVKAEDAFGPRDPSKIKLVARREFQKVQINPQKGDWVNIGNQTGKVLSVTAGRVRMDFNHKLAGYDLKYTIEIKEVINEKEDKIQSIIGRRLPGADLSDSIININGEVVKIELPHRVKYYEYIQFAKKTIAQDIKGIFNEFKTITYLENFDLTKENL
jgi:FKBP-type peptidyl-prolyl cis-trans isomerase 2